MYNGFALFFDRKGTEFFSVMAILQALPQYVLFPLTLFVVVLAGGVKDYYCKHISSDLRGNYLLNTAISLIAVIVLASLSGFSLQFSTFNVVAGIIFGLVTMIQMITHSAALSIGSWAYTTVIVSLSTVFTALYDFFVKGIPPTVLQIIGIVLMVACLILSTETEKEKKKASIKWVILCLLSCIFCAGIGYMQKLDQEFDGGAYKGELLTFLTVAFVISTVFSFILYLTTYIGKNKNSYQKLTLDGKTVKTLLIVFLAIGCANALNHAINLYLCGQTKSVMFFPIVNGGDLILSTIISVIFFKEKLSKRQWIGFICGVAAMCVLCI